MTTEGEQQPNLVELYDRYNREDLLAAYGLGVVTFVTLGISGLALATMPTGEFYHIDEGGAIRANAAAHLKWAINTITLGGVLGTEVGVGFVGWKRSEARRKEIALQIAQAEGRVVDETNDERVMFTSALSSTLVYGIEFKSSSVSRFVNTYVRPIWEMSIPYSTPERRMIATFQSFDYGVAHLPVDEWTKYEIGITALNLGQQRWEDISRAKGTSRLRGYSYVMLSEINRRLGDTLP